MRVHGLTTALLFLTAPATLVAQAAGSFELTGFGRYTRYDSTLAIQEGASGGGSLGFYPIRNLAIEAEGAYTKSHSTLNGIGITNVPLRGRLTYHIPLGGFSSALRLGAGYVHNLYRDGVSFDDPGFTGVLGFRWGLSPSFGFKVDGTADYIRNPDADRTEEYINWGAQVGLTLRVGGKSKGPKDHDKDGVADLKDSCPNTVTGKAVDAYGCASNQKDADRDAVNDELDRCPDTGAGEPVDTAGCAASQKDDDKDGVSNLVDQCANTSAAETANSSGCAPSQRDNDQDGVPDATDQCPNTPAGDAVNTRGCFMERDTDGDNVPDGRDRCPDTPKADAADANGCTILFHKGTRSVILRGVTFLPGRATLTPEAREILRDVAGQLVENPQYKVQVSGHTDIRGTRARNLRLSLARARTVETFLEANGVPPTQVTAKGFGPDVPIASNKTATGRAKNRRVELNRTN
jgi:outer membrane protein OmpA-like peptidoglycan-associated protein